MRRVWLLAGAVALAACAGGVRPSYAPLPEAQADTLAAAPAVVTEAILAGISDAGLRVQWQSVPEGFVETLWYNVVSRQSGSYDRSNPERFVRLRFFVDPLGDDRSVVTSESVIFMSIDQSRMERDREMMVPPNHVGREILGRILTSARRRIN